MEHRAESKVHTTTLNSFVVRRRAGYLKPEVGISDRWYRACRQAGMINDEIPDFFIVFKLVLLLFEVLKTAISFFIMIFIFIALQQPL